MLTRLITLWEQVRSSLWAVPLAMILSAVAIALIAFNVRLESGADATWYLYSGDSKEALSFLNGLMSSMITLATLVFSITMVVLTLGAQQLGPRLIKSFMADWVTQSAIGLFMATIVYLVIVLRTTSSSSDGVPNLAVTIGTALVLSSIVALPLFVHRLARSTIADNVITRVGDVLDETVEAMLPPRADQAAEHGAAPLLEDGAAFSLAQGGYIQAIDVNGLVKAACQARAAVRLLYRPGHHVVAGIQCGDVIPAAAMSSKLKEAILAGVIVGGERTPVQDVEFTVRQLVEVAARALSSGVNDPYTAIAVVDRLALSLGKIMRHGEAPSIWRDEDGSVRLIMPASTFEGIVDAAFNEIRQFGWNDAAVMIRLAEKLDQLASIGTDDQRVVLAKHLRLLLNAGQRGIQEPYDLQIFEERIAAGLKQCPAPEAGAAAARERPRTVA